MFVSFTFFVKKALKLTFKTSFPLDEIKLCEPKFTKRKFKSNITKVNRLGFLLEIELQLKNIEQVFFDTRRLFWKWVEIDRITTEKASIWFTSQVSPMIFYVSWFCVEKQKKRKKDRKKLKHIQIQKTKLLHIFNGRNKIDAYQHK